MTESKAVLEVRPKELLVPVDFSVCSRRAYEYAIAWAKRTDAKIDVLHVFPVPLVSGPRGDSRHFELQHRAFRIACSEANVDLLEFLRGTPKRETGDVHTVLRWGDPKTEIAAQAAYESYDLVVMGTHYSPPRR
jgi:universal stress protein A